MVACSNGAAPRPTGVRDRLFHNHTEGTLEKTEDTLHTFGIPRLDRLQRPHEHLVQAHAVRAVLADDIVGIDHILQRLGHLGRELDELLAGLGVESAFGALFHLLHRHQRTARVLVGETQNHALVHELLERLRG